MENGSEIKNKTNGNAERTFEEALLLALHERAMDEILKPDYEHLWKINKDDNLFNKIYKFTVDFYAEGFVGGMELMERIERDRLSEKEDLKTSD